jgi:hypothetical protein
MGAPLRDNEPSWVDSRYGSRRTLGNRCFIDYRDLDEMTQPFKKLTRLTDLEDLRLENQPQYDCRALLTTRAAFQLFVREAARRIPNSMYWTLSLVCPVLVL